MWPPASNGEGEATGGVPPWLTVLEHTADLAVLVTAGHLSQLFCRAAQAMFFLVLGKQEVRCKASVDLRATAPDREALLVYWLSELNYLHVTEGWLFGGFRVRSLTDTELTAAATGEKLQPGKHRIAREIKAVTFHDLRIDQTADGMQARIVFDV